MEAWAILRTLKLRRIVNAAKLVLSYLYSLVTQRVVLRGSPMAFAIEPTSICNLHCPECPTGTGLLKRPRGMMDLQDYRHALKQLAPRLMYLNLYVQGEPFMHPHIGQMIKEASCYALYTSTSTNGHYITKENARQLVEGRLTRLIFSVDGASQESYELYRIGGKLNRVKQSIIDVIRARQAARTPYPIVVMQFLVFRHNEHELGAIKKLARTLRVDKLEIKTAQLNEFGTLQAPTNSRYSRYADTKEHIMKQATHNRCWRQWHAITLTWDGRLAPCCYDKDAEHSFGNLQHQTLHSLWFSPRSIAFKQQVLNDRHKITMCRNCPEGAHLF